MNIGIVGLGLIGGSMAKAIRFYTDSKIYGFDIDENVVEEALSRNILDRHLTKNNIHHCELIIIALYPDAAIEFVKNHADMIDKNATVIDCCGVKRIVCDGIEPIAKEHGFTFIGAHPMAGLHLSGFAFSSETMFKNASFVLCPNDDTIKNKQDKIGLVKNLAAEIGFTNIQIATPSEHDNIIAFTSQLCHVVSNAYVKNSAATVHKGFSAGSYRDLTRVAKLNENMWTELFLENKDYLVNQLDELIENLVQYSKAIHDSDADTLCRLLRDGRERKEAIDGDIYRN